jgi:hypothetical protein
MTAIVNILKQDGPMLSSELARQLASLEKVSVNTASQRISREKAVEKIGGFFKNNQSLIYLSEQSKQGLVYPVFECLLQQHGIKYWNTLNAIKGNGGRINRSYLECYTNYPLTPLVSHKPFDEVMQMFVQEGVLVFDHDDYAFSPKFHAKAYVGFVGKALEQIKHNVLEHFASLQRNIGMVSYETGELLAEYGNFRWGYKGVSPVIGLRKRKELGFVVADILIGRPILLQDVQFFTAKLATIMSYNNAPRLIPYLITDNMHPAALHHLKEKGIVVGFIDELFGEKYAELLKELILLLKRAGESLNGEHPDKYLDLIRDLRKYNSGLLNNIRGALFEYMVGHLHVLDGAKIEMGREIFDQTGKHEIDIKAEYKKALVFAECKSTKSPIDAGMVHAWITKKVPAFHKWAVGQEAYKNLNPEFEYWSTSGFTEDALAKLKPFESSNKYTARIYGPEEIKKIAKDSNDKKLRDAIDSFYLKNLT